MHTSLSNFIQQGIHICNTLEDIRLGSCYLQSKTCNLLSDCKRLEIAYMQRNISSRTKKKVAPIPGIEPGFQDGESRVIAITLYRIIA